MRRQAMIWQIVLATVLCAVAIYAHYRIPFHTAGSRKIAATHAVLVIAGLLAGGVGAMFALTREMAIIAFVQGFGVMHIPAAVILFLKRARHEGRS